MAELAFSVLGKLASSAFREISLAWGFNGELKKLKETISTIEAVLPDAEEMQENNAALRIWLTKLKYVFLYASKLLDEIDSEVQLRSQGSAGQKLCRFFSSSNPLVFRFRIGHRIKTMIEWIDEIAAEKDKFNLVVEEKKRMHGRRKTTYSFIPASEDIGLDEDPEIKKKREMVLEIFAKIDKLNLNVTYSFFRALEVIGLDEDRAKQIVYIVACIVAVCMDPFFLYIPFLSHTKMCLGMNKTLWKVAVALRTYVDSAFAAEILQDRTKKSNFSILLCVCYFALLPIPQVLFSEKLILKTLRGYTFWNLTLFCQYGTRLVLIFRSCEQLKTRVSVTILGRFNALVYLCLYLIVGQVIGASWYYLSIKRQFSCWNHVCKIDSGCVHSIFRCDGTTTLTLNSTLVNEFCPINPPNAAVFDYGIYLDALQSHIVEDKGLLKKFLRCFFWGLRNLSSFASNLQTSTDVGETFFAITISVVALILLIYIIGNIQRYAELASARSERIVDTMKLIKPKIKLLVKSHNLKEFTETVIVEHIQKALENDNDSCNFERLRTHPRIKRGTITDSIIEDLRILETSILNPKLDIQRKAEKWLLDNNIPPEQNNILFYLKCRLEDDEDVNLKSVLSVLPYKHEWMTKKDLCFDTLKKVPRLQNIDEEWFISMSSKLKPVIYQKESYIVREGEPLDFIIFITNGIAWSYTTITNAGGRVSNSLEKGDFFGQELVEWKLDTDVKRRELESDRIPLSCIPISTANVKSHTQVEALVLMTKDLALCSDFLVATSKLRRIIKKQIILNAILRKSRTDSATERVDSSSRTEGGASVQREIEEV